MQLICMPFYKHMFSTHTHRYWNYDRSACSKIKKTIGKFKSILLPFLFYSGCKDVKGFTWDAYLHHTRCQPMTKDDFEHVGLKCL